MTTEKKATFLPAANPHNPSEIPSRGRRILNETSVYNPRVTKHAVSDVNVMLVSRPREVVELECRGGRGEGGAVGPVTQQVLDTTDTMDTHTMMLLPTTWDFMQYINSDEFTVYDDDVFIVTYAKTGTTWMTEIVLQLLHSCDADKIEAYKQVLIKCLRIEIFAGCGEDLRTRVEDINKLPRPRLLATHLPLYLLPDKILDTAKIIITFRNPKDTAVSMYHFGRMNSQMGSYIGDWDTFLRGYINGEVMWGSWIDWHLPSYMRYRNKKNVLMIQFEDMKKDCQPVVERISEFLGTSKDKTIIEQTLINCGFDVMKEKVGPYMHQVGSFDYNVSHFFRKGRPGEWRNQFTVAQNELYDAILDRVLKHVPDFTIQYE